MPVAHTVAMPHIEGVSDSARARELYRYYQPSDPVKQDTSFPRTDGEGHSPSDETGNQSDVNITSHVTSSKVSSPDTALTAFCQLTTWRTGAQRAMISVIDESTQHFIAEGTKTVDLMDNTKHAPGDEIWMGCGSVAKAGRLCERTIQVAPEPDGSTPCFIVNDLSKDERFNTLPFVTGPPHLRFYAGVPLITKRGIPIGSLFVVDDRVGKVDGMPKEKIHFMGTMAHTIMRHMEMVREVEEHRRGMKMSRGLASFVEGRAQLAEADFDVEDTEGTRIAGQFEPEPIVIKTRSRAVSADSQVSAIGSFHSVERKEKEYSAALMKTEHAIQESHEHGQPKDVRPELKNTSPPVSLGGTEITVSSQETAFRSPITVETMVTDGLSEVSSMKLLFSRSANLIREAFEVDGGAVFYDAQTGFSSSLNPASNTPSSRDENPTNRTTENHNSGDDLHSDTGEGESQTGIDMTLTPAFPGLPHRTFSRVSGEGSNAAEILGFSTSLASSIHGDPVPSPHSFIPFPERVLHVLLKRYSRGKLWTFDSDGSMSSSSDDEKLVKRGARHEAKDDHNVQARNRRVKSDAHFLAKHFPGVRQLLFVPLWDASRARWLSGCFAWSTEPTRILSKQNELSFLSAFGNSVMAEWARIDTEIADQKKSDFIGSISHELRSPLHGILASAEFLAETSTGWSKGLVETIDSCGRTLLDTINHILDYSKINHFEKNWRKSRRVDRRSRGSNKANSRGPELPMISLYQVIDISVLCEEVVESVFAGHVFQNVTAKNFDMVPVSGKMSDAAKPADEIVASQRYYHRGVVVILDVDAQDYHFNTQPGALRRLVMNLLGNALKYTSHGYVHVKLETQEMMENPQLPSSASTNSDSVPKSMIKLTVSDTGRGISPEFLRSKLYTPFAQENSLSSGTGLGLSIVRKIVSLLEGSINIDSQIGRGTQVRVTVPLMRDVSSTGGSSNSTTTPREPDQAIVGLRNRVLGQSASLYGFDYDTKDPIVQELGHLLETSVSSFLVEWYGVKIVPISQRPNIVICNEPDPASLRSLLSEVRRQRGRPIIVVLCAHDTKFDPTHDLEDAKYKIGFVAKPVGPLKLAKAIASCLDGHPPATPGLEITKINSPDNSDLSSTFDSLSISPHGGEVFDNSRMSADSANARKAIESPTPHATIDKSSEFPFPSPPSPDVSKGKLVHAPSMPTIKEDLKPFMKAGKALASKALTTMEKASATTHDPASDTVSSPTLLVVDDNHINLKLLTTYLNRRKYEVIDQAMHGLEAVQKFESRAEGYDIIFMDITMPILDGFGATKQIRSIESARQKKSGTENENEKKVNKRTALIIAFTGRSSLEDQAEAVRVGIDLFMTKPVALKEVGKIITNWTANRERESEG